MSEDSLSSKQKENSNSTDILKHLLNNEKSNNAYVMINNLSKCSILVSFERKTNHSLYIKSNSIGRILLKKGNYKISSKICNADYIENRKLIRDVEITLNTA